eukprot:m.135910 g.135910  ORF g.135910 m.135910 type:complete len:743 (+) comp14878_c0_seq4:95-2323(+)
MANRWRLRGAFLFSAACLFLLLNLFLHNSDFPTERKGHHVASLSRTLLFEHSPPPPKPRAVAKHHESCFQMSEEVLLQKLRASLPTRKTGKWGRLFLCSLFCEHTPCTNDTHTDLATRLAQGAAVQSIEYRLYLRDQAMSQFTVGNSICSRNFGHTCNFLGAGSYGAAFACCLTQDCPDGPRAVVKMTIDEYNINSSSALLAAGQPGTAESAFLARFMTLVEKRVFPFASLEYVTWRCDHAVETSNFFKLDCEASEKSELDETLCYMRNTIDDGEASPSIHVIAQEEIAISLAELPAVVKRHYALATRIEIWRAVLFEITYALARIQQLLPGFRHNDLSWYNIRLTLPRGTRAERLSKANVSSTIHGTLDVPRDAAGRPQWHRTMVYNNVSYHVPDYGFHVHLSDFDFARASDPTLHNPKVDELREKPCGVSLEENICGYTLEVREIDDTTTAFIITAPRSSAVPRKQGNRALVRIAGNGLAPDGVFLARIVETSASSWLVRVRTPLRPADQRDQLLAMAGRVCFFETPWIAARVDDVNSTSNLMQLRLSFAETPSEDWGVGAILHLFGRHVNDEYRVVELDEENKAWTVESTLTREKHPSLEDMLDINAVRVASPSKTQFYAFGRYGIVPLDNDKYDLHFVLNALKWAPTRKENHGAIPDEILDFVTPFLTGDLGERSSSLTHAMRISDAGTYWHCNRKGELLGSDPRLAALPTPALALTLPFFRQYKLRPSTEESLRISG